MENIKHLLFNDCIFEKKKRNNYFFKKNKIDNHIYVHPRQRAASNLVQSKDILVGLYF